MKTIQSESIPGMFTEDDRTTSYSDSIIMPVIKLDFNGVIISSNKPGIIFLGKLRSLSSGSSLSGLLHDYPGVLKPGSSTDISVNIHQFIYHFSVVAFDEAGYVGFYGYRIERNVSVSGYSF
jgi:hypothetical protein